MSINFYIDQLKSTASMLVHSMKLDPTETKDVPPWDNIFQKLFPEIDAMSRYFGTWSRVRLLFHMVFYEKHFAFPSLNQWGDGGLDNFQDMASEEEAWKKGHQIEDLINDFRRIREVQIKFLSSLNNGHLQKEMKTGWGIKTLEFVVLKSIQHSFEHGNKMLRHAIFGKGAGEMMKSWVDDEMKNGKEFNQDAIKELNEMLT